MAYFTDLTPYTYFKASRFVHNPEPLLNVGWLAAGQPFEAGEIPLAFIVKLQTLPTTMHTRGWHSCPFCTLNELRAYGQSASSTCEVRVAHKGVTYAAPNLIKHYVSVHGYRPPAVFIEAVLDGQPIGSREDG